MKCQPAPRMNCPLDAAMSILEGKWKMVILCRMFREGRPLRFKELMKVEGISSRILTKQLKEMESDGLVIKRSFAEVPPRTEYSLTAKAESLIPILRSLAEWGMDNMFPNMVTFDSSMIMPESDRPFFRGYANCSALFINRHPGMIPPGISICSGIWHDHLQQ